VPENDGITTTTKNAMIEELHYPLEVMLVCSRWYAAHPLNFRHLEELMPESGVFADHSIAHRWSLKILPRIGSRLWSPQAPVA